MASAAFYAQAMDLLARRNVGASLDELAALTGWQRGSVESILSKARHGRIRPPSPRRSSSWSPEADALLETWWEHENSHQIAARLQQERPGTTYSAVNARAHRLGLEKPLLYGNHRDWWTQSLEARP